MKYKPWNFDHIIYSIINFFIQIQINLAQFLSLSLSLSLSPILINLNWEREREREKNRVSIFDIINPWYQDFDIIDSNG